MNTNRNILVISLLLLISLVLFWTILICGPVKIPTSEVMAIMFGAAPMNESSEAWQAIVLQSRLPMAITAILAGGALSIAGLLLQTTFSNPLAGPSVLGISSAASLGVALLVLSAGFLLPSSLSGITGYFASIIGAIVGAGLAMLVLLLFSSVLKSAVMLLIAGIMLSYLTSAAVSLLNFFAPAESVKNFVMWGMGSYSSVTMQGLPIFAGIVTILLVISLFMAKPLNALLLGERYAANMGYSIRALRTMLLTITSLLTAIVTAFCGPIGFLGIIVPHVARIGLQTSNHSVLIPATILAGMVISLLCTLISVLPHNFGVLPINAITPIISIPVILYIILNRKKLKYFN